MSKRKYREAAMAKRQDIDRALGRGYALSPEPMPLTDEQTLEIDHAYNEFKADPSIRLDKAHQEEVRMAHIMLGRAG
jgi:hypothetical protein